jgi:biotin/methionine sulfoxide reductase
MSQTLYTANHWGTYEVELRDGKVHQLRGLDTDPSPSPIAAGAIDSLDNACRIPQPMVRKGYLDNGPSITGGVGRGREPFVAVSWDEAQRLVADEVTRVREEFGNPSIFAGSYGWSSAGTFHHGSTQLHRFLNCLGGFTYSVNTYSLAAGEVILPHVLGSVYGLVPRHTSWRSIAENAQLVVAFGGLPIKNAQVAFGGSTRHTQARDMTHAREQGVRFVNISPLREDAIDVLESEWLAVRPNTDVALMLALAHTLLDESLHDKQFLETYTVGFEVFSRYLRGVDDGVEKNAAWASVITEIPAQRIAALAREMAASRTMISLSWSLTRQHHGEQPFWAGTALAAMLGQIGLPGTGVGYGYSAVNNVGQHAVHLPWTPMNRLKNPVSNFIPVARIADLLLKPGETFDFNGEQHTYPDIKMVCWAGGNPFHHHQDLNRLVEAWRRPETIVVNEPWWNAMARHCDIVLPATTPLERTDVIAPARGDFAVVSKKAVEPFGEARNDHDIFAGIARHLGVEDAFTEGRTDEEWLRHLYDISRQRASKEGHELPGFDEFWENGLLEMPIPDELPPMLSEFRADPRAHPLPTPSGRIEIFSSTIDSFDYEDCPGHPTWMEPVEWLGADTAEFYPIHLVSNQPKTRLHSHLDSGSYSRSHKVREREVVTLHPEDAGVRGIKTGDIVRLFNKRGSCLAAAKLSSDMRERVAELPTGAWFDPLEPGVIGSLCKHGNPNVLTVDIGTSKLGQGPCAHSCLVQIERCDEEVPAVTAFVPPEVIYR